MFEDLCLGSVQVNECGCMRERLIHTGQSLVELALQAVREGKAGTVTVTMPLFDGVVRHMLEWRWVSCTVRACKAS